MHKKDNIKWLDKHLCSSIKEPCEAKGVTGPTGPRGHKGNSIISKSYTVVPSPTCPTGGTLVQIFSDNDCAKDKLQTQFTVCNGLPGPTGSVGFGRVAYTLSSVQINVTTVEPSFATLAYFPWKATLYSSYNGGNIVTRIIITDRTLFLQIVDENNNILGNLVEITSTGSYVIPFVNPSADTYIALQANKNLLGGTSPQLYGINIEFNQL